MTVVDKDLLDDDGEWVATFSTHSAAVQAMMALPPNRKGSHPVSFELLEKLSRICDMSLKMAEERYYAAPTDERGFDCALIHDAYMKLAEMCRNSKGRCFCGCHISEAI